MFGLSNIGDVRVAFVTTSSNGSAEKPTATAGQTVDQVFGPGSWFMDAGLGTALSGNTNPNDSVATISTGAEFDAWFAAGQPVQGYDNNLVLHDVTAPGNPISPAPQGKSMLNRWPAGSNISLVFYLSTGTTNGGKPIVEVGSDGKAITAYMPFSTVAKSGDATRSSAGYVNEAFGVPAVDTETVLGTSLASPQVEGTAIDIFADVSALTGSATPTGSVEFFDGSSSLGSAPVNGSGRAEITSQVLAAGSHTLSAVFTDSTSAFNTSTSADVPFTITGTPATGTQTAAAAIPGANVSAPVALSATVTADDATCPAGSVQFKEGATVLQTVAAPTGATCVYDASHTFSSSGAHNVTAVFTPDDAGDYTQSQGSVSFTLAADTSGQVDEQTITAEVPEGAITVTTPYTPASPLDLGTMALTADLSHYSASAQFDGIHVLDTRAGAEPWELTALAGALTNGSGGTINGQNVGLTTLVEDPGSEPGLGVITTHDNPAAPGVAPADAGLLGLGGSAKPVLDSTQGPSDVTYHGTMTLNAPTTTPNGVYTGTVTFTVA